MGRDDAKLSRQRRINLLGPADRSQPTFAATPPGLSLSLVLLSVCFVLVLVLVFEFSNGFRDTANAVATVIYINSLKPV